MSYVERNLDITFRLGQGNYGDSGFNTVKLSGLRASAVITKGGSIGRNSLELRVWGVPLTLMNKISTTGKQLIDGRNNTVQVEAGNVVTGMNLAFVGTIITAYSDFQGAPEAALVVSSQTAQYQSLVPVAPSSFPGSVNVASIIAQMASAGGFGFENSGVSVQIAAGSYFPGTITAQIYAAARAAGINVCIDDASAQAKATGNPVVAIWPKNGSRAKAPVTLSAKDGSLVGYPQWTDKGIKVQALYNPNLIFGATVNVDSIVVPASGAWTIFSMMHELESQVIENGKWFSTMECALFGKPIPAGAS